MQKKLSKAELKKLRKSLPKGAYETIAEKTGLKASSVEQILFKPERFKIEVIECAIVLAEKTSDKIDDLRFRVKNTI